MKRLLKLLFSRVAFVALFMLLQIAFLALSLTYFRQNFTWFYIFSVLVSISAVLYVLNEESDAAYKIAWIIPIILMPVFGTPLYFLMGRSSLTRVQRGRILEVQGRYASLIAHVRADAEAPALPDRDAELQSGYLSRCADAPLYVNTCARFLYPGELLYQDMLAALEKAERFIFLEYFIVEPGEMWNAVLDILKRKAAEGLDVRLIYDDMGSILTLPRRYSSVLEASGVRCAVFRRFLPVLTGSFNNRDHRKICVIDGAVAYTGGINMADEYINRRERFGHWMDSGIMVRGEVVCSFTAMFLSMWDFIRHENESLSSFLHPAADSAAESDGFIQPFADTPMDDETVGRTAYINMISRAREYVYITTPYLVLDSETAGALATAAKSGVDVRIITPGIPDKWYVFAVTRSYYAGLIDAGVRIFEYTPGFIHSKTMVCDDICAICGTINLDYRSLFLHYECAAWMYGTRAVGQIRDSFSDILPRCTEITADYCRSRSWLLKLVQSLLRVFAPMM